MNTKARSILIAAIVLVMSALFWSLAAAQDASSTPEPTAESTAESPMQANPSTATQAGQPMLGVSLQDNANGAVVQQVLDGSPAADAGLQVGDLITSINGTATSDSAAVAAAIHALHVGDQVTIGVTRGSDTLTVTATLAAASPRSTIPNLRGQNRPRGLANLGLQYNASDQTWTITDLSDSSPLYTAGLRQGDVIKTIDGKSYDPMTLRQYLSSLASDATVTLSVERDGATQDIQVSLADLSALATPFGLGLGQNNGPQDFFRMFPQMPFAYGNGRLGVAFVTLDPQTAQEHNITMVEGALITQVADNSPASDAGIMVNDIITAVNGEPVDQERTLRDRLIAYEPGDTITLSVLRDGQSQDIQVTLGQPELSDMQNMFPGFNFGFPEQPQAQATPEAQPNM